MERALAKTGENATKKLKVITLGVEFKTSVELQKKKLFPPWE